MPLIWALLGGLASIAGSLVGRVLIALGIGYATFTGFDASTGWLLNQVKGSMSGMPLEAVNLLGFLWVDRAIAMVFSAFSAALTVKLAGSTAITKMVTKGAP